MLPFFKNKGLINITETSLSKVVKTEHKKAYFFPLASASCSGKKWQTTAFSYSGHIKSSPPPTSEDPGENYKQWRLAITMSLHTKFWNPKLGSESWSRIAGQRHV